MENLTDYRNKIDEIDKTLISLFEERMETAYKIALFKKNNNLGVLQKGREEEVIKYNNDIAEIKAKWERQQENDNYDKTTDLAELMGKYGVAVFDELKQNEKYALLQNHFKDMSKEEALNELQNNSTYISNIGKYNYNKLLQELNNRNE